ncbi:hypothetical protein NP493_265g01008 [Ridgeia piscesae]|uniref:Uncharacterized protein n=1 Tax=Ridgeia piscesae TaxID=27915 RepID=A0AAD9NXW7_RIDPI|nr:hypothetical protein NP493_265g01008 [Ridgeia piscesae]
MPPAVPQVRCHVLEHLPGKWERDLHHLLGSRERHPQAELLLVSRV